MTRIFRLQCLIAEHFEKHGRNWSKFERAIADAHARALAPGAVRVRTPDRRKLGDLFDNKNVNLRRTDFEALDDYFSTHHQGLAFLPIFERTGLLPSLVAQGLVHTLIGARSVEGPYGPTIAISHLDTRAHADLVRELNSRGGGATPELHTVLMRAAPTEEAGLSEEAWQQALTHERAVVSFGSPLANHGTEVMWARMFGRAPYRTPTGRGPDVALVLPKPLLAGACSSFVEDPGTIRGLDPSLVDAIHDRRWALRVGERVFVADSEDQQSAKTYGVILAQRRANGQLWVSAAGLHGAGTHAAALAIRDADIDLSSGPPGKDGSVYVRVVEARVGFTTSPHNETRVSHLEDPGSIKYKTSFSARSGPEGPF